MWLTPVLSPHRAYRSVHGASNTSSLNRLIRRREFKESRACESFVCYASCHGSCVRRKPISSAAVGGHICVVFRHTELHEVLEFGLRFLPLLPDVCTDSVPLSHIGLIVHRRFYFRFIGTDVKRHFCAYRYPATSFTLSADFLNGFASLLSKDPRGIFYNFLYFTCTVASTAQGYFRRFLHFLYHSSIIYDSVIPRGIGFHIPFSFLISARINCLLTSGW